MDSSNQKSSGVRYGFRRIVATWLINAVAIYILANLLSGFDINSFADALGLSLFIGLLNALIWPFFTRFLLPVTVLTLGMASLVLNGLLIVLAVQFLPESSGVHINDWFDGLLVAIGISIINPLFTRLLSINDDDFYYRNVIQKQARRQKFASGDKSDRTGIVFLEIDGLAHEVLLRAIRGGSAPNLARWVRQGSHSLLKWECDWSSQTGAMQAGILHGNNWNMPSFRWYEKGAGKAVVSNRTKDAMTLEKRQSNGKGLLHYHGASRANLFSGDAPYSSLTMSTVLEKKRPSSLGADYMAFFSNPSSGLRSLVMVVTEVIREIYQQIAQKRRDVQPRVHRGLFPYPLLRAFTNVLQTELGMSAAIQDIYAGRPVIYAMFLGYDEVAHHSGTERAETLAELEKIDRSFGRLEKALTGAPRKYEVVVLADHGQTQGATFSQRYGQTLGEVVEQLTNTKTQSSNGDDEGSGYVRASAQEMRRIGGIVSLFSKIFLRSKESSLPLDAQEAIVMPSGALGSISFPGIDKRATLEEIESSYPGLINGLVGHAGVGFLLVRSKAEGDLVISKAGKLNLSTGKLEGNNPLEKFGPHADKHIARTSSFPDCPDIIVNSTYWPETDEVAAFEELVGSHGAMGGPQQYPFVLYPSSFKRPKKEVVGAESVHKLFRGWLVDLGWESYKS